MSSKKERRDRKNRSSSKEAGADDLNNSRAS